MGACVSVDANGFVRQDSSSANDCSAYVILSSQEYKSLQAMNEPFDYAQAASLWSFAFTSVLLCWLAAKSAGTILSLIRKG